MGRPATVLGGSGALDEDPMAPDREVRLPAMEAAWQEKVTEAAKVFGLDA
jgi:hypothetical protein